MAAATAIEAGVLGLDRPGLVLALEGSEELLWLLLVSWGLLAVVVAALAPEGMRLGEWLVLPPPLEVAPLLTM